MSAAAGALNEFAQAGTWTSTPLARTDAPRRWAPDADAIVRQRQPPSSTRERAAAPSGHQRDAAAEVRTCGACGHAFTVTAGERAFSDAAGTPLATRCRACRPSRRAALATGAPR